MLNAGNVFSGDLQSALSCFSICSCSTVSAWANYLLYLPRRRSSRLIGTTVEMEPYVTGVCLNERFLLNATL